MPAADTDQDDAIAARERDELQPVLESIVEDVRGCMDRVADEAREVAEAGGRAFRKTDYDRFGIAVFTRAGTLVPAGNAGVAFPIQSISKVFALEVALEAIGEALWQRMGREPSGDPFNSIIDLERDKGIPRNPFINAGALVVCDMLVGLKGSAGPNHHVVRLVETMLDGAKAPLDADVMASDRSGGDLNRSLMYMAKHHGNLHHPIDAVMEAYVHQCAISLDCRGLAMAGRFLMHDDDTPGDTRGVAATRRARNILALMMLCGQYDGSGDFAYRVGLPAKSGVGGGILAIVPHRASVAVWSPGLDTNGNSRLGVLGLEMLTDRTDWSVFGAVRTL
ncbi:glutaminase A [Sphingomonas baiyangensis]|uniref:Glutaminase n=1 Tax=Sphingomonas baiyangensis TaxID=2572576 RepID=A0A4U1L4Y8_9SPHN|nr:glutaminase A [Sphingomonas baiyangensis]TKD51343.1 glutaminase A [Sphingomonas baiyangensis]